MDLEGHLFSKMAKHPIAVLPPTGETLSLRHSPTTHTHVTTDNGSPHMADVP